ncbi:hypothetical protein ACFQ64_16500 [Streptomyces sp. NPDC056460]|uniref:hypothetical protein n=1 Tax=Streptomyces sp. NPDC056460 TaxID=3345825 RepID=UPI00368F7E7D
MGEITVSAQHIDHLLHDPVSAYGSPSMQAHAALAISHRRRPPGSSCCPVRPPTPRSSALPEPI